MIVPDTGSGYGGKHTGDAAIEAARLAKAAGKPVKLVWTREEEFTWAYFRPAGVIEVTSGGGAGRHLTAWEFHNYNSGGAGDPHARTTSRTRRIQFHPVESPLAPGLLPRPGRHRQPLRPREPHGRAGARELGMDPLAFRCRT